MKRIKAACICQTLHFTLKDDISHEEAVRLVQKDLEHYKATMERNRTPYRILEQKDQPDGSIIIKVVKQYSNSPLGEYLN